jgi:hypothetical protein
MLLRIEFLVPSGTTAATPFSFCVANVSVLFR